MGHDGHALRALPRHGFPKNMEIMIVRKTPRHLRRLGPFGRLGPFHPL